MRDLAPFAQFKKLEKNLCRGDTFSKVAGFSLQLYSVPLLHGFFSRYLNCKKWCQMVPKHLCLLAGWEILLLTTNGLKLFFCNMADIKEALDFTDCKVWRITAFEQERALQNDKTYREMQFKQPFWSDGIPNNSFIDNIRKNHRLVTFSGSY